MMSRRMLCLAAFCCVCLSGSSAAAGGGHDAITRATSPGGPKAAPSSPARIVAGPLLTDPRPGCLTVRWLYDKPAEGVVYFAREEDIAGCSGYDACASAGGEGLLRLARLEGLQPAAAYSYRVGDVASARFIAPPGGASAAAVAVVAAGDEPPFWDDGRIDLAVRRGAVGALVLCPGSAHASPADQARAWAGSAHAPSLPAVFWPGEAAAVWGAAEAGRIGRIGVARGNPPPAPEDESVDGPGRAGLLLVPAAVGDEGPPTGAIRMIWTPLLVSPGERTAVVRGGQMRRLVLAAGSVVLAEATPREIRLTELRSSSADTLLLRVGGM